MSEGARGDVGLAVTRTAECMDPKQVCGIGWKASGSHSMGGVGGERG